MNSNPTPNTYQTSDTSLAVFLFAEGFQIIEIDYTNPRAELIFKNDSTALAEAVRLYSIGKAQVNAATYARLYKKLTRIIVNRIPWTEGVINA